MSEKDQKLEGTVSSHINMNVGFNYVVDLAVQREFARLEDIHFEATTKVDNLKEELTKKMNDFDEKIFDIARNSEKYLELSAAIKKLGWKHSVIKFLNFSYANEEKPVEAKYSLLNTNNIENSRAKNMKLVISKSKHIQTEHYYVHYKMTADLYVEGPEEFLTIKTKNKIVVNVDEDLLKEHRKGLKKLVEQYCKAQEELYKASHALYSVTADESKARARITELTLGKSDAGQQILNIIEGTKGNGGFKLIG